MADEQPRDPRLLIAMDSSRPRVEREAAAAAYADSMAWHLHPRWPNGLYHGHLGGDQPHDHQEDPR